jgi:hypothetical protein
MRPAQLKPTPFIAEPFEAGYGHTVGNSLRRVLLSSLEGAAITSIRITGAQHEFATLTGIVEDVTDIVMNLKKIKLKAVDHEKNESIGITPSGISARLFSSPVKNKRPAHSRNAGMTEPTSAQDRFKGRHFDQEIIILCEIVPRFQAQFP